ncbi:hypothetical protein KXZ68_10455 [Pseudomonas sp. N040]|nr:hypothetical protein [Pseudomonas sp. N040]
MLITPVVMAGGSGSRLWPLSRQLNPKQFLAMADAQLSIVALATRSSVLRSARAPGFRYRCTTTARNTGLSSAAQQR